jgi:S-adenosylmethionine:tRNA ribosyltransferase-isomerase
MNVSDFDFELPEHLIAQHPPELRGTSRLLVVHRNGRLEHGSFSHLERYLEPRDLLVLNNTQVFPARLLGHRIPTGGLVECLLLNRELEPREPIETSRPLEPREPSDPGSRIPDPGGEVWNALVHPGQKLKPGSRVVFERGGTRIDGEILSMHFQGRRSIRLTTGHPGGIAEAVDRIGHIPLPPYIKRPDITADRERYQTVYARHRGSVAAPTAGLHFTAAQLEALAARGVERAEVTLHVGYGTFKPVKGERVEDHVVDGECYTVSPETAAALTRARRDRRRTIAVGTTTVRALESLVVKTDGEVLADSGETTLFIHPGHTFKLVDAMITNFHLPRSSLLMLVSAFAGRDRMLHAYREAVDQGYRFYSYGDAMLIL